MEVERSKINSEAPYKSNEYHYGWQTCVGTLVYITNGLLNSDFTMVDILFLSEVKLNSITSLASPLFLACERRLECYR